MSLRMLGLKGLIALMRLEEDRAAAAPPQIDQGVSNAQANDNERDQ